MELLEDFKGCEIVQVDKITSSTLVSENNKVFVLNSLSVDSTGKPNKQILSSVANNDAIVSIIYHHGFKEWQLEVESKRQQPQIRSVHTLQNAILEFEKIINQELPEILLYEIGIGSYPAIKRDKKPSVIHSF